MTNNTDKPIARGVTGRDDDDYCSICGDDTLVLIIQTSTACNFCDNQINLCSSCTAIMKNQMNDINDGLNIKV